MPYLLDTQVVSFFVQARREHDLATAAGSVPCVIADEVRPGALAGEAADDVIRHANQIVPTWWADWRADH
jgi:hypothetical protein